MKFDQKYNYETFSTFLREFLPEDYAENEKDIVDLSRCKLITQAREVGYSPSLDVYVLEMTHAKDNDPRVSIATDAFMILATFGYDKALVVFKNDESHNYRFSYLTISLDLNEKNKVVAQYSNARRYSFYLGEGAKTKTPEQQLVKRGSVKDTTDLLSRFSLEVVNKQFYLEMAKLFDELVEEQGSNLVLPSRPDAIVRKNFAMRLIGRLMFCWFLKQKKSKDGQLIPDEILSSVAVKDGYYHEVLEPLFFEVLNTQIDERDVRSDAYDKVPYLNGGLFSPQHDDYYDLDRAIFVSRHINTLHVSDAWFKTLFELLETYNFTIDENTVFDQELSVDPEMLGRIFENLLAEINPDTGSSERKRTGSFYTPRQVVEYMVDESLIEHFRKTTDIDRDRLAAVISYDLNDDSEHPLTVEEKNKLIEAIESLKILDPACGSGAFPIGVLQKIVWILQRMDPDCKLWLGRKLSGVPELYRQRIINEVETNPFDYTRKLDVIKNSIFGVDIQPIAVEMSRLRCFLTLVVESEIDDAKKNRGIEPLPNLDFKFVCANTLVSLPPRESNGLFEDHSGIEELSGIMSEYFSSSNQRKAEIRQRFGKVQKDILSRSLSAFGRTTGELTIKLSVWDPFSNAACPWFDPEWMFGIYSGFDIVIGNPPYIQLQKEGGALAKQYEDSDYLTFAKTGDIYSLFYEMGLELLREGGHLVFITSNKWMRAGYGKLTRKFFAEKTNPLLLVDFAGQKIFQSATVDTNILMFSKGKNEGKTLACTVNEEVLNNLSVFVRQRGNVCAFKTDESWVILNPVEQEIKLKIEQKGVPLKDWDISIYRGVLTGYNDAFIIDGKKKEELISSDPKSAELIRPILRGRDIKRYTYEFADLYLIATFPSKKHSIDDYPAIKQYLLSFGLDRLKQTGDKGARKKTNNEWFETQDSIGYWDDFSKQKIVWGEISDKTKFAIDVNGEFVTEATTFLMTGKSLFYLLGFLNSRLSEYLFAQIGTTTGVGTVRWKKFTIEQLRVPKITEARQEEYENLVREIVTRKSKGIDGQDLITEVDRMIYKEYDLSEREIEEIEKT